MTFTEILSRLHNVKGSGDNRTARCPAHKGGQETNNSLSITKGADERVLFHCHAGCVVNDICAAIGITVADLFHSKEPRRSERKREPETPLTLEEFAAAKKLPVEWLRELGIDDFPDKSGLAIAYFDEEEQQHPRLRKRTALRAKEGSIWLGPKDVPPIAYGVWRLQDGRESGDLLLVEGETDAISIWLHNLNLAVLGLPGAGMAKTLEEKHLAGR